MVKVPPGHLRDAPRSLTDVVDALERRGLPERPGGAHVARLSERDRATVRRPLSRPGKDG